MSLSSFRQIISKVFNHTSQQQVTANIAKERMQSFLRDQRGVRSLKDENLNQIKGEVLQVVSKYWKVNMNDVTFSFRKSDDRSDLDVFEMQVTLPSDLFASPVTATASSPQSQKLTL
ncbi:hypothetical protein SAMD00019534_036550 [Acytostelium subglobosum LB1]|uniref:hypothetical protein n=1 Tax=Acytostelium subglobosum LB1 TaxID=1410327 RepID=UPI0006451D22|nr:hypothetical protein SAMD00019534_036550 [Acytostelium subglobosum LB1]GAM20480.1 hypothetical protein SAMD00019534_036550 [Acytostelium subglobosum LB1]|eukprot:XP_012760001.1 hypothetical protein SAMD00019534_036550 [Acytostelium subglobosum LB1]